MTDHYKLSGEFRSSGPRAPGTGAASKGGPLMARILIADNASFMRSCLKYIFENAGHQVIGMAKGGQEALELYGQLKPDLVTLDILMEGMDGIAALGHIMKEDPKARVIMVTALGQE